MARQQVVRTTQRAAALQVALVALAALAVVLATSTTVWVGLGNRDYQKRIKDCTDPRGGCYQQQQKATAAAIETILRYIDGSFGPHRLRNEAENSCQVQLFAGSPPYAAKGVSAALKFYNDCVLMESGNTAPPPIPSIPITTSTTR